MVTAATVQTVNLKADLPSLEAARKVLANRLRAAQREGVRVLKIIHGYGSTGRGGTLCHGLRKSLTLRRKDGLIRTFIPGEDFSVFHEPSLALLEAVPELRGDPDLDATNEGVTVIWIR